MSAIPAPSTIFDLYRRAQDIASPDWPLRWRAGVVVYAELHAVTLAGEPAVRLPKLPGDHPTLFGLPLVRDLDAARDCFEIEAKPRDVWVMVLRGKTSRQARATMASYPVSPLQDSARGFRAWPYEDIPSGPRVWTDALQAPLDGLVAPDALPRVPSHHTDIMLPVPPKLSVKMLTEQLPPTGPYLETRRFRREQWRDGNDLVWLWRRVE